MKAPLLRKLNATVYLIGASGSLSQLPPSRVQDLLSSELCSGFKPLEILFKGGKDLVNLTMENIVWFHIHVAGKCLLIHLHLLACPDIGSVYSTASFPCFPAEDALRTWMRDYDQQHVEQSGRTWRLLQWLKTQLTLIELCWLWEVHSEVLALYFRF